MRLVSIVSVACVGVFVAHAGFVSAVGSHQEEELFPADGELTLEGVIVSSDPSNAVALLRRPGSTFARAVKVGERVYGFELLEVSDSAVLLGQGEEVIRLTLTGRWQRAVVADANPSEKKDEAKSLNDPTDDGQQGRGLAEVNRQIQRSLLEERLSREMPRILTETGLTPRVEEGVVTGFRITRLPKGTVLDEAGIRAGDILLSINEISLNSPYALMDLYPRLQEADEIRVLLERGGDVINLVYSFD